MLSPYLLRLQALKNGLTQPAKKPLPKPIPKKSKKRKEEDKQLKKQYVEYLALPENKFCNIQIDENCGVLATTVNHLRRRGKNVLNKEDWEPSCGYCNIKIEEKDGWARQHGHLKSKFNNQ